MTIDLSVSVRIGKRKNMINSFTGNFAWLSNTHESPFTWEDVEYPTAEHAFQAAKFSDISDREEIASMTLSQARREGRNCDLPRDWTDVRDDVMADILYAKFSQNVGLKVRLLLTDNHKLVQGGMKKDTYWGQVDGQGKNRLGQLLEETRNTIRTAEGGANEVIKQFLVDNDLDFVGDVKCVEPTDGNVRKFNDIPSAPGSDDSSCDDSYEEEEYEDYEEEDDDLDDDYECGRCGHYL